MNGFFEEEEELKSGGFDREIAGNLVILLKPHIKELIYCGTLLAVFSILSLVGPLLIRHAIDVNFVNKDFNGLLLTVGLYAATLFLTFLFNYLQTVRLEILGQKIILGLRDHLFDHLITLSLKFFDRNPVGKLISRVESDTEALRELFTFTVVTILSDLLMLLGMFVVMFVINWKLALILASTFPFVIFNVLVFNKKGGPLFLKVRKKTASVYGFLEEYLNGMQVVQVFRRENAVSDKLNEVNKDKAETEKKAEKVVILFINFIFLLNTLGVVLVLGFGSMWALAGSITIGTLVMFLNYIQRFFGPIFHLSEQLNIIQRAFAGARRVFGLLAKEPEVQETDAPAEWNGLANEIRFEDVWFAYIDDDWVLQEINFTVKKGERWALVGATGGGKSSIINLLLRFYDPQRGRILVDGIDIRNISLKTLRVKMGLVLQDIFLFPMNVRDNLRMEEPGIKDEQIWEALRNVRAENTIKRMHDGLDAELAEKGGNLSQGERQLLSFARALVFDPEILILDEATSAVDPLTEKRIQRALGVLMEGRTSLVIAHRLRTILDSDVIMVIKNGRIIEKGSHEELLRMEGEYRQLYNLQAGLMGKDHELEESQS